MRIRVYDLVLDKDTGHGSLQIKDSFNFKTNGFTSPNEISRLMTSVFHLDSRADEYVFMIAFNSKMRVLGVFEVSHGTVNYSPIEPRGLFMRAIYAGAVYMVIVHNHPSGETTPSETDRAVSRRIKEAGELLGIKLVDHIIIAGNGYYSFKENGLV